MPENEAIIETKTVNGCWNCLHGGNLKILCYLLKILQNSYNINLAPSVMSGLKKALYNRLGKMTSCSIDPRYHCEPGLICDCWKYNNCGFQAKEK